MEIWSALLHFGCKLNTREVGLSPQSLKIISTEPRPESGSPNHSRLIFSPEVQCIFNSFLEVCDFGNMLEGGQGKLEGWMDWSGEGT